MKKTKNIVFIFGLVFMFILGFTLFIPDKSKIYSNPLSVLIEKDGTYIKTNTNKLKPEGRYVFNESKTYCQNGSKIIWNGESASFIGSVSDKCNLYFAEGIDFKIDKILINGEYAQNIPSDKNYEVEAICNGAKAMWNYSDWSLKIVEISNKLSSCNLEFTSINEFQYLNQYIIGKVNTLQGLKAIDGKIINENGYRYEGNNPYNYILFNNELWRIIGVFETELASGSTQNLVKIIREESFGSMTWDKTNLSSWETTEGTKASLNYILNEYYFKGLDGTDSEYCRISSSTADCDYTHMGLNEISKNMVENVKWYLGGVNISTGKVLVNPNDMYNYERGNIIYNDTYKTESYGHIGLMYPSDYGYSTLEESCPRSTEMGIYANVEGCASDAWILKYGNEWVLNANMSSNYVPIYIGSSGRLYSDFGANAGQIIRPVLYLKNNVYIVSGSGKREDPYIVNI